MPDTSRSHTTAESARIAARLDALPFTGLHAAIVVVSALGLASDVMEATLSNVLAALFTTPGHPVSGYQLPLLLASIFIGGAIGAPLLGIFADRFGRRTALSVTLLLLTITSLFAAAGNDLDWLTVFRILSGLALGAYPPLAIAYLTDILPPKRRGAAILIWGAIGFLGAPAMIFLVRWLTPLQPFGIEGWRWALFAGGATAFVTGMLFLLLPESPRWLATIGGFAEADVILRRFEKAAGVVAGGNAKAPRATAVPPREALETMRDAAPRRHLALMSTMYFLSPWPTIGFPLLSSAVMVQKGFRIVDNLLYLGIAMAGPTIGTLAAALVADRIERRTALATCAVLMAAFGMIFAVGTEPWVMIASGLAFNLTGSIYITALGIYSAELFPTHLRAAASSSAWAVNRVATALVPLALLPLLYGAGVIVMFMVLTAALFASIGVLMALGPRGLAGRPVN
jgi:putative MFS transporter